MLTRVIIECVYVQWHAVRELRRGEVYTQGSVYQLSKLTGWVGSRVLYIGCVCFHLLMLLQLCCRVGLLIFLRDFHYSDNLFSDLVEPSRANGWRTGAIIRYAHFSVQYF